MRDEIRPTTIEEAVERARSMVGFDTGRGLVQYRLGYGGKDPFQPHPGQPDGRYQWCDCSGFVAWCLGLDRRQPASFPESGGWISTDSMVREARRGAQWFTRAERPTVGSIVVYPDQRDDSGRTRRQGHTGIVTWVPDIWDGDFSEVKVTHCSASNWRKGGGTGGAILETSGALWGRAANSQVLHFLRWSV